MYEANHTRSSSARRAVLTMVFVLSLLVPSSAMMAPANADNTATPTTTPTATPTAAPTTRPDPLDRVIMKWGDRGKKVRNLKARLVQRKLLKLPFNDVYTGNVVRAVKKFQKNRGIKVSGRVDKRTWKRLVKATRKPTKQEKSGQLPRVPGSYTQRLGALDSRCKTGVALCIDKTTRTMQWVVNGTPKLGLDVRFGGPNTPTREGKFSVYRKSRDHVSSIYHTPMPFAMFFSGGQAVHYSANFAANGYNGASHGCVNVRDYNAIASLFDKVAIGTKVIVYRS